MCAVRGIHALSFIRNGTWVPDPKQDGYECAKELIKMVHETDNPAIFASVMRLIVDYGHVGAQETAFFSYIGMHIAAD